MRSYFYVAYTTLLIMIHILSKYVVHAFQISFKIIYFNHAHYIYILLNFLKMLVYLIFIVIWHTYKSMSMLILTFVALVISNKQTVVNWSRVNGPWLLLKKYIPIMLNWYFKQIIFFYLVGILVDVL